MKSEQAKKKRRLKKAERQKKGSDAAGIGETALERREAKIENMTTNASHLRTALRREIKRFINSNAPR